MIIVMCPTDTGLDAGTILALLSDEAKLGWGDRCSFIERKGKNAPDGFVGDVRKRKVKVDLSKIMDAETLAKFVRNKTEIYDVYRNRLGVAVGTIESDIKSEINSVMTKLEDLAVNYRIGGVEIEPDIKYANDFEREIRNTLQNGIKHHVNRVEEERGRLDFEANGEKPDLINIIDLSAPGIVLPTSEKQWIKETSDLPWEL